MDYKDNKEDIIKELEEIGAGSLLHIRKKVQFSEVEPEYFSNLQVSAIRRYQNLRDPKMLLLKYGWAVAASLVLLISAITILSQHDSSNFDQLSEQDILAYLEEMDDLSHNEIIGFSDDTNLEVISEEINKELIIDYIQDNLEDLDVNLINFE